MKLLILFGLLAATQGLYSAPEVNDDKCFCQEIEPWPFGEVECDESLPNGLWKVGDTCRYTCADGQVLRGGDSDERECRPAIEDPAVDSDLPYVWKPAPPQCVDDPTLCLDEPFWREQTPGPVGIVDCPESSVPLGYPLGHQCSYICPEGHTLVGSDVTTCDRFEENGEIINRFRPPNPCCEQDCDPNRVADLLFVVDWSSSIKEDEWDLMTNFLVDVTRSLSDNPNLRYGVIAFGNGVRTELNIPFQGFSQGLLTEMGSIPFNGVQEGTHTIAALEYVARTVFSTSDFGENPEADNLVVFITDGVSTDSRTPNGFDVELVRAAAEEMHAVTDRVYSVGVGLNRIRFPANRVRAAEELHIIAQTADNVVNIEQFNQLSQFLERITQIACEQFCAGFV